MINIITRFSVPCFMMLSGAFLLEKQQKPIDFYKKSLSKIFLPTTAVAAMLVLYRIGLIIYQGGSIASLFKSLINGTFYNYWYLYALFFIYLLAPVIRLIKENLSKRQYYLVTIFMLLWAVISQATSNQSIAWNIGVSIAYLSYFMAGNMIKEMIHEGTINKKYRLPCVFISAICAAASYFFRMYVSNYYSHKAYASFLSPTTCIMSICVFIIFGTTEIKENSGWLAQKTFFIYLFHTFWIDIIYKALQLNEIPELLNLVICVLLVFIASLICSTIFEIMWGYIIHRTRIIERMNNSSIWTVFEK